jgi:RNA polymerase sigma-70 factor (ECF subfamily)
MNLEKLVVHYKAGNEKSFDKIYKETLPLVKSAILNYITDKDTVLDLIQDTYLTFVEKKETYNSHSFSAWIYIVAKNKALDYLKKKKEVLMDTTDIIPDKSISPCLTYVINKLEPNLREVFLLKVLVGYSSKKVSTSLGIDVSLVNKYYYETKEILRKELKDYEVK